MAPDTASLDGQHKSTTLPPVLFWKTRMCRFHLLGSCTRGPSCGYAHDWREIRERPNLRKTTICQGYQRGRCVKGEECPYAHGHEDLRATPGLYKTSMCRFWLAGSCLVGESCRYAHGSVELQPSPRRTVRTLSGCSTAADSSEWLVDEGGDVALAAEKICNKVAFACGLPPSCAVDDLDEAMTRMGMGVSSSNWSPPSPPGELVGMCPLLLGALEEATWGTRT